MRRAVWVVLLTGAALSEAGGVVRAQTTMPVDTVPAAGTRPLSLQEALELAEGQSEEVTIAQAAVTRAEGGVVQARSGYLPQLSSTLSYSRTLASQFQGAGVSAPDTTGPVPCGPFVPNPSLPLEQRVDTLEQRLLCPAGSPFGGLDFGNLGFGARNSYNFGLSFSQALYTGGRVPAQTRAAKAGRSSAEIGLASARASVRLDVSQAYYNAELADQLVAIAEASLAQAEATLQQARVKQKAGATAEFDVLRAQVSRDNQRPVVIQQRQNRELAYLRLKQLLNIPLGQAISLTTPLETEIPPPLALPQDTTGMERAPVRQAAAALSAQEATLRVTRSQRLPTVALTSQYGKVAFGDLVPDLNDFRTNWNVGVAVSLPLFAGGRIHGQVLSSQADVAQARAQLQLTRELAELDTRNAVSQLRAARAALEASAGTVEEAQRAYQIAELRYREGISTQLELSDSRLLLQQARVNRAQAQRDFEIARMRVQLLPDLPIQTAGASSGAAAAAMSGGAAAGGATVPSAGAGAQSGTQAGGAAGAGGLGSGGAGAGGTGAGAGAGGFPGAGQ
ncbi:MAG TPA: TolC family protein [Longimicrobiaceae bacterium]|nr:TolC family protein [Longimicrobiaceae bacterium]